MTYLRAAIWSNRLYLAFVLVPLAVGIAYRSLQAFMIALAAGLLLLQVAFVWLMLFRRCKVCGRSRFKLVMRTGWTIFFAPAEHDHDADEAPLPKPSS